MPSPSLLKRDWKKDHVYLIQFPRAGSIPSVSPYSLKLETWLRLCKIPFSNVSNEFTKKSAKGQVPFIELNGRQVADSNFIIENLKHEFKKDPDANLSATEKGQMTAYMALIENLIVWCSICSRSRDNAWFATDEGFAKHMGAIKLAVFKNLLLGRFKKSMASACNIQGIGRHSQQEVEQITKNALNSLELLIGNKPFFFGANPTTLDITAFGHISQFLFPPQPSEEVKSHLHEKCPNLVRMLNRLKEDLWPDWKEATETVSLFTNEEKTDKK